jgi:thioester reductase-like protein
MVLHNNVVNYSYSNVYNVCHKIIKKQYKTIISVTNIVFDIFVTESLLPIINGITIYFANDSEVAMQTKLSSLIENNFIDVIQTTPTKIKSYILDKGNIDYLKKLKAIILGGETLPVDLYNELIKYTDAHIYNIYGPAETTVWSTNAEVIGEDITIGKPIANTQIYILDSNNNPLPIGVAGELCIAGDGVGKGYLNRLELTAERFVPNPFATESNRHGNIMYHTGDLARWRADGEIEYLGRIDTQVKIRGLRIELGEIESVMSSMEGIGLTAVADKRDENNRQYLVGYYTSDTDIDEKELRKHLSAKLPKYMIPNYFMHLDTMPMTPSGKIDRKNLPIPDFTLQTIEYVEPANEIERKLCTLLEELLHMEKFGINNDFFEYGGDSLTAIEYVAKAHTIGIDFALQNVFDYPTVAELAYVIENGNNQHVQYQQSDFDKYSKLFERNVIDNSYKPVKKSLGNILLTGATGFLGVHVLDELMRNENGKIYCLVRSGNNDDRRGRLYEILHYYFGDKYTSEFGKRIIPIVGNIENDNLADEMPKDVQTVIHTAASVKHYGSYKYFNRVNVEGTKHVVNYAKSVGAKLIHISTLSVSGNSMADDFTVYRSDEEKYFYETSLYIGQPLDNVYIHSKFEAEKVVYDAMLEGLDAKVIRVGNLTNRARDYKFQPNYKENAFLTRAKSILEFGLFPDYLMPLYSEFSPVDLTAEGIVKIAQYADKQCVFHLNSNRPIYFDRFLEIVRELGIPMKIVEGSEFNTALDKTAKDNSTEYIYEAFQNDMDENGKFLYDSNIHIVNDFTMWFMNKVGFEWCEIDLEYIKGYIEYFRKLGYLEV